METYYEVTYTNKQGESKRYTRDTVERGYYLYKSLVSDGMENVVLREVSANGIAQLRPYTPSKVKEQTKQGQPKSESKPKTWFEFVWGISEEEYDECVSDFAKLHGTTKEEWRHIRHGK